MGDFLDKLSGLIKHEEKGECDHHHCDHNKNNKKKNASNFLTNALIIFLIGVLLVIVGSMVKPVKEKVDTKGATAVSSTTGQGKEPNNQVENNTAVTKEYKEKMQDELTSTLEKIQGVGKVHAMIYFSSGSEQVPVYNEDTSKSVTKEEDTNGGQRNITQENGGSKVVMENKDNAEKPFITKTYNPKISGICVVAEGADDSVTELRIRQAVISLYGLEDGKVQVYPMEK